MSRIGDENEEHSSDGSSINKVEFNRVDSLDVTKDVWNTLRMAHEGSRPVRKANVEML
jgi:hypothetical protein